jgi:hypothetical protein
MNEPQLIPVNEWKSNHSPAGADQVVIAEPELGAFVRAVIELFSPGQPWIAAEDWVDELELVDTLPGPTRRDWGWLTIAASAQLARRLNTDVPPQHHALRRLIPKYRRYLRPIVLARLIWLNRK